METPFSVSLRERKTLGCSDKLSKAFNYISNNGLENVALY